MELAEIERHLQMAQEQVAYWKHESVKAKRLIEQELQERKKISLKDIKKLCDEVYDCDISDKCRDNDPYAWGRHVYAHIATTYTKHTLSAIGSLINRNHATIINSRRTFEDLYQSHYPFTKFADQALDKLETIKNK